MNREDEKETALIAYLEEFGETQDSDLCDGFIDGWDKADETMIDKVCKHIFCLEMSNFFPELENVDTSDGQQKLLESIKEIMKE